MQQELTLQEIASHYKLSPVPSQENQLVRLDNVLSRYAYAPSIQHANRYPTNLTGRRRGRNVVYGLYGHEAIGTYRWLVRCDCGNWNTITRRNFLNSSSNDSCGCLKREKMIARRTTHGRSRTAEYKIFHCAVQRCNNPTHYQYHNYGGRGIEMRFQSFEEFFAEVGPRPDPNLSIDRINNDGHYEPGNLRWATRSEQQRNRRPFKRRRK
jgi:hypothetical protein